MNFYSQISSLFQSFIVQSSSLSITGISTDTRTLKQGDLFIALNGENFNGADYIPLALQKGAVAFACLEKDIETIKHKNITLFKVDNTLWFYQEIAKEYLKTKTNTLKIAITGSAGKTSTKEWLYDLLSTRYRVYKNKANFNNQVGVPLSILELQDEEIAIFEMGTGKKGDIARLAEIVNPDIGLIVSLGEAHLEFFGTLYDIAIEKASLFHFAKECFVSQSVPFKEDSLFKNVIFINPKKSFTHIENLNENGYKLFLGSNEFIFPFFGSHNLDNLGLGIFIAKKLGLSDEQIAHTSFSALPSFRNNIQKLGASTLILDCYNANPLSMHESIKELSHFSTPPILILGDMLELGEASISLHEKLGEFLNQFSFPYIFFIGDLIHISFDSYHQIKKYWSKNLLEAKQALLPFMKEGHLFFVKGSRGIKLEEILTLFDAKDL